MQRSITRAATSVFLAGVALVACGSSYKPSAGARTAFVDARAEALCAVKDKAFTSEAALEHAYTTSQAAKITDKDNQWLKRHLETDVQLRADISARFTSLCPGGPAAAVAAK